MFHGIQYIGGCFGATIDSEVSEVYNLGNVKIVKPYKYGNYAGGFSGYENDGDNFQKCYNLGELLYSFNIENDETIGSFFGKCSNTSNVGKLATCYTFSKSGVRNVGKSSLIDVNAINSKEELISIMKTDLTSTCWEWKNDNTAPKLKNE